MYSHEWSFHEQEYVFWGSLLDEDLLNNTHYNCHSWKDILSSKEIESILKDYYVAALTQPHHAFYVHKDRTHKVDVITIARSFIAENKRRRNYFGSL